MSRAGDDMHAQALAARRRQALLLSAVIVAGLACVVGLNRWMETNRPPADSKLEEEKLYVTGAAARRMSLSFNGLIADWYWMRSLQYVGRKVIAQGEKVQFTNLAELDLKLLYPLLDASTTLDPQFIPVYEYGAVVLREVNDEDAVRLLHKGIENNPSVWRLHYHLGYIYWQRKDYKKASEVYAAGARLPGAPPWMQAMSARMLVEGDSRATAREIYKNMLVESDDPTIRRMAELRLAQIASLDERDVIRAALKAHAERAGRCPGSWREVAQALRAARLRLDASGAPLDPADTPYLLAGGGCDVDLDPKSQVPYK